MTPSWQVGTKTLCRWLTCNPALVAVYSPFYQTEHQQLVVDTVRSLLKDGLAELGDIPSRNDTGFKPWPGTIDELMTRFIGCFIECHNDELQWQYSIWLNLTAEGLRESDEVVRKRSDR